MTHILVIDDEESIRFTLKTFLEAEGYEVRTAKSFEEARASLEAAAPDLIFVDIILPGKSGIDVLRHVRNLGLRCPVVMITGEPSVDTAREAVRLGAFEYTPKPVTKDDLLRMTRVAMKHKRQDDEMRGLVEEKERLRLHLEAMFNSLPDAIFTVDRRMAVTRINDAARTVLGVDPARILGEAGVHALGVYQEAMEAVLTETLNSRKAVREYRVEYAQPAQTLIISCSPLLNHDGEHLGAVLIARDITRQATLERELSSRRRYRNLVGQSAPMNEVYRLLQSLAETDTTVLITGPSGTGKELVAEALHYSGNRADKALIKVNCSALSEYLLESELFGHVRGAFTGAVRDKIGRFAIAHGGTIFLDEIGDISPRIQLKLLRVLQEKEFERVGDSSTVKVDVRVLAATNQNLREKVRLGEFREDLYYRLKVVEITMPALKDRRDDIPLLAEHFIDFFNQQFHRNVQALSPEARALLLGYHWPGNVRELRHAVEHGFILCQSDRIEAAHLPPELREQAARDPELQAGDGLQAEQLSHALALAGGNKAKAARSLGISRQTLYRKLREFELPIR